MTVLEVAEGHRRAIADLTLLAANDLRILVEPLDTAEAIRDALLLSLPDLVAIYGSAAATLAADTYDEMRDLAGAPGRFSVTPALPAGAEVTVPLARWAVGPLFTPDPDRAKALERATGGLQRHIANTSRSTLTDASILDNRAEGWQRAGRGECGFCTMLIARGAVYTTRTADFGAHDHCNCTAVPAFTGQARPVQPYTPSARTVTDADRARVRDWIATHT